MLFFLLFSYFLRFILLFKCFSEVIEFLKLYLPFPKKTNYGSQKKPIPNQFPTGFKVEKSSFESVLSH